ncbi:MAG: PBP1A family penicillin-binding protein [Acidobacteria bacterium]|nr:PBP1A family penicillin-binding protein [Acidobacteriota bacterium]
MVIEVTSLQRERRLPRLKSAAARFRERATRAERRGQVLRAVSIVVILLTLSFLGAVAYLYTHYSGVVDERLASGYLTSRAGLYAAPRVLRAGQKISRERLADILRRSGYVDAEASRVWSGRFKVEGSGVEIRPRETGVAVQPFKVVQIEFDRRGQHLAALAGDGVQIDSYTLEPEPLTNDATMKTGERGALAYADIPPTLARAILSIEDRRFFEHGGLDVIGIARALWSWGGGGGDAGGQDFKQGGSTITQQLVKNTYLTPERTLRRKFNEAVLASVLERRLSKEDIFALYCNEIYLGQRGSVGVRGVAQASRVFFGKEPKDLSLAEAATIAGMIQSPGRYAPDRHPEPAKTRRDTVLAAMLRDGAISEEQRSVASAEPVRVAAPDGRDATAPYFIDYVNRGIEARYTGATVPEDGRALRVYTTIDLELQRMAEEAVHAEVARLEKVFKGKRTPQAALVALDPRTGDILAMVGGNSYADSQLNRATDARRQPGSVFKPIVYAAAIESGISPLSTSTDAPREFRYDVRAKYRPANYGGGYSMRDVTLREGLVRSLNVVTVDAALRAGLTRVASLAESLGLPKPEPYPSLALGTTETTPLEVAIAYTAFANAGRVVRPTAIARVDDAAHPSTGLDEIQTPRQVLKPSTSYMLTDIMTEVINRGTARAARGTAKGVALAGKTGTSRDGWFAGYTPNLVCVVYVGFDDNAELGLTGAESALPVWSEFIRRAVEFRPELGGEAFARPDSVTTIEIDPETGALATDACPRRERVALTHALAPVHECYTHGSTLDALASLDAEEFDAYVSTQAGAARASAKDFEEAPARTTPTRRDAPATTRLDASVTSTTRVEVSRDGRPGLTNELRVAQKSDWR